MKCDYCGTNWKMDRRGHCSNCGAPPTDRMAVDARRDAQLWQNSTAPVPYNGTSIVYPSGARLVRLSRTLPFLPVNWDANE